MSYASLEALNSDLITCSKCPRLVAWREHVAANPRASYRDDVYWARPVPGFGDPRASIIVMGLAPAAHGANRTGRMFTGDRSGDWLYRAMYRAGLASQPTSKRTGDGLELYGAWVTAPVKCAPPANKPSVSERDTCHSWLADELGLLMPVKVLVALGGYGYRECLRALDSLGFEMPRPRTKFAHGVEVSIADGPTILTSYHPSQQNTFTGKLTEDMIDTVFARAVQLGAL